MVTRFLGGGEWRNGCRDDACGGVPRVAAGLKADEAILVVDDIVQRTSRPPGRGW